MRLMLHQSHYFRRISMIKCPTCNNQLEDNAKFCFYCGSRIPELIVCPHCGSQSNVSNKFCAFCGKPMVVTPPVETLKPEINNQADNIAVSNVAIETTESASYTPQQPIEGFSIEPTAPTIVSQPEFNNAPTEKSHKKLFIFGGIGLGAIALIVAAVIVVLTFFGAANPEYLLYIKDDEINYTNLAEDFDNIEITSKLISEGSENYFNNYHPYYGSILSYYIYMSDDGKTLFFPDKITNDSNSDSYYSKYIFNLYYRDVTDKNADAIKVDSNVRSYHINDKADLVTYIKGDDQDLFQYSLDNDKKNKIASNINDFYVSDNGENIIYVTEEYDVYFKSDDNKEKLATEISQLVYVNDVVDTVFYIKDENLYKHQSGEDKVKITSDVFEAYVLESGEMYYIKKNSASTSIMNFIDDDKLNYDNTLTEPVYPTYPDFNDYYVGGYVDYDAYYSAIDRYNYAVDEYYDKYTDYQEKLSRDSLRAELNNSEFDASLKSLYFFDGETETLVADDFYTMYDRSYESSVLIFKKSNLDNISKIKLSEISSIYSVENTIREMINDESELCIAVKNNSSVLEHKDASNITLVEDDLSVYYMVVEETDDENHENYSTGTLYKIAINDEHIGQAELYDYDIANYSIYDNHVIHFKEVSEDGETADLYLDKVLVDYDVAWRDCLNYNEDNDILIYMTDFSKDTDCGTLKAFVNGKSIKIADDVYDSVSFSPNGKVLYFTDYSTTYEKGELRAWDGNDSYKIDDDVSSMIYYYGSDSHYRFNFFY